MKERIKNEKGFTLVELLAVIVILGLLMAIAIPSVTKYITQSRVKTLVTTMDSYVTAVVTQVNNGEYKFSDSTKVFAIPIECISLEKGGTNPFGNWYQANSSYWAYVLIHYDSNNYNYEYGFTFKDDAGYGLYPTLNSKITNSMVKTGYDDLTMPKDGKAIEFVSIDKWEGFSNITTSTMLEVLVAESDGEPGDGQYTCTLCQKGDNYEQVEREKEQTKIDEEAKYLSETTAYAIYSDSDKSLTFVRSKEEIKAGDVYDGINVTASYTDFEDKSYSGTSYPQWSKGTYKNQIKKVIFKDKIKPTNISYWFAGMQYCTFMDVTNLDVSNVTSMNGAFYNLGENAESVKIVGLEGWNTSNVTNMSHMFVNVGMRSSSLNLGDLGKWNTSNVTTMSTMFYYTGRYSEDFYIGDLGKWNTSKVTNMHDMFYYTGEYTPNFSIGDLSNWNTSKVTKMSYMFTNVGSKSVNFSLGNLEKWDVSNVETMYFMFGNTGVNSQTFYIGDLSKWNTSKVTNMSYMFYATGYNAQWNLDCSNWNVDKVTSYGNFNGGVTSKVTSPTWVN